MPGIQVSKTLVSEHLADGFQVRMRDNSADVRGQVSASAYDLIIPVWYSAHAGPSAIVLWQALIMTPSEDAWWMPEAVGSVCGGRKRRGGGIDQSERTLARMITYLPDVRVEQCLLILPSRVRFPSQHTVKMWTDMHLALHKQWMEAE